MIRVYKFRAYPTCPQEGRSGALLRDHADLYNAALEERREAWRMGKHRIGYCDQTVQLKDIRRTDPHGQGRHSAKAQERTLRRLDDAFKAFYKRCQAGKKPGYPRFKPYSRFNQVTSADGDGAKWTSAGKDGWARAYFKTVGHIKVKQHREVKGVVKTITVKREGRRWYVIVTAETGPAPLPLTGRETGIDVSVAQFLTTSDGEIVSNPRILGESADVIADLEHRKARAKPGSGNRKRLRRALAREHHKIRNQRRDFHHKTARALVNSCDVIAVEDLRIGNMTRSASGTLERPGTNVAAKSGLNRSILDAGRGQFMRILAGKAAETGRRIVLVDPRSTSITCHQCGRRCERPRQDTVICPVHGAMNADVNGAINIASRAGLGSGRAADAD